eukprot:16121340-Heterocapsa_arctica.AAC.1
MEDQPLDHRGRRIREEALLLRRRLREDLRHGRPVFGEQWVYAGNEIEKKTSQHFEKSDNIAEQLALNYEFFANALDDIEKQLALNNEFFVVHGVNTVPWTLTADIALLMSFCDAASSVLPQRTIDVF